MVEDMGQIYALAGLRRRKQGGRHGHDGQVQVIAQLLSMALGKQLLPKAALEGDHSDEVGLCSRQVFRDGRFKIAVSIHYGI